MTYSQLAERLSAYADDNEAWDEEVQFKLVVPRIVDLEISDQAGVDDKGVINLEEV